jgi:F420-dependent oxidoreductase-like protein
MKISISLTNYSWSADSRDLSRHLLEVAGKAEAGGVDTLWVPDHLLQMDPTSDIGEPMLEAYSTLAFLACATERVRLGTMVTWASIRPPALLVKAVTTLDVLSGGRSWLGIGAGYQGDEAAMLGLPFPATAERFERMEEILRMADHMWTGEQGPFEGPFHRLEQPICSPMPVTRPRIVIGGMGEQRTLPLVARYADACNLFDIPDGGETVRRKLEALRRACEAVGRNPEDVEVTLSSRLAPNETADAFSDRCRAMADQGIDHVVLVGNGAWTNGALDTVADSIAGLNATSSPGR